MNVQHEVELLVQEIKRLGSPNADGKLTVKFGVLFSDDRCANLFEALVGTLRAAKRKKIVSYEKELLLQGVDDNAEIVLLKEEVWTLVEWVTITSMIVCVCAVVYRLYYAVFWSGNTLLGITVLWNDHLEPFYMIYSR